MKTAGIVCEYNPMHNGHVYQIDETRKAGATHIVCVMSGNFVQRGECAFADKWTRADIAVHCGADLVVDLPVAWSCDSAQNFAFGAVSLLNEIGIDMLSFGSESSDAQMLKQCAELDQNMLSPLIEQGIKSGLSYPMAYYSAVKNAYCENVANAVSLPNNTLAVEYIKALRRLDSRADIFAVKRIGSAHDDLSLCENYVSAAAIRSLENFELAKKMMPQYSFEKLLSLIKSGYAPAKSSTAERAILSSLRKLEKAQLEKYVTDERGLSDRIYTAARTAQSLEELFEKAKTKNITMAKIRRTVMRIYLEIMPDMSNQKPPYIRVLASNKRGLELLGNTKTNLPVVTRHSQLSRLTGFSKEVYDLQCRSSDLYGLFAKKIRACSTEQTSPVIIIP